MTEMPTRHQNFLSIVEKLATMPPEVDHNGIGADEKARNTARMAQVLEASAYADAGTPPADPTQVPDEATPAPRLRPNPAQGSSSAQPATATNPGGSLADRMRANAQAALGLDPGAA